MKGLKKEENLEIIEVFNILFLIFIILKYILIF